MSDSGELPLIAGGSSSAMLKDRVPGSQHALMSAAMLDAKRARMKVEMIVRLSPTHCSLQNEGLRATKRIEQTLSDTGDSCGQEPSPPAIDGEGQGED